jgi:hypothetical protein
MKFQCLDGHSVPGLLLLLGLLGLLLMLSFNALTVIQSRDMTGRD